MKSNILFVIGMLLAGSAHAYIGPGAGLGAIATLIAVVLGLILILVGFVWFPLKRYLKNKRQGGSASGESEND